MSHDNNNKIDIKCINHLDKNLIQKSKIFEKEEKIKNLEKQLNKEKNKNKIL